MENISDLILPENFGTRAIRGMNIEQVEIQIAAAKTILRQANDQLVQARARDGAKAVAIVEAHIAQTQEILSSLEKMRDKMLGRSTRQ